MKENPMSEEEIETESLDFQSNALLMSYPPDPLITVFNFILLSHKCRSTVIELKDHNMNNNPDNKRTITTTLKIREQQSKLKKESEVELECEDEGIHCRATQGVLPKIFAEHVIHWQRTG